MRLSVIIPTFERPAWIQRAVWALGRQVVPPDEVIAVVRDTDEPTYAALNELRMEPLPFDLRIGTVSTPGFVPPVREGFRLARGDVVAVTDDDAEALPDWTYRMLSHYAAWPEVAGVGGRVVNVHLDGTPYDYGKTDRVGFVSGFGRAVGDMYKEPAFQLPQDVDFFMGGNMSFRGPVARAMEFDLALNRNVGMGYELDLGLQARASGRLLFDPKMVVLHYSAPRRVVGSRKSNDGEGVRWAAHNEARILARRLPPHSAMLASVYGLLVGYRRAPGIVPWALGPVARKVGFNTEMARYAVRGRAEALFGLLRS